MKSGLSSLEWMGKEDSTHEAPSLTEELWRALALEEKEFIVF